MARGPAAYPPWPAAHGRPGPSENHCLIAAVAHELCEECGIEASIGALVAESRYRYPHATKIVKQ